MTPDSVPPRWARALLERVLPDGGVGRAARADLDAEWSEVVVRLPRWRAGAWYGWEVLKIAAHFARESSADARRGGAGMEALTRNLRFGLRRTLRAPGFSGTAIATIALGIGANVAIFSVVDAALLEPLPYDGADRLVAIWEWNQPRDRNDNVANPGNFARWRDGSDAFRSMSAVSLPGARTVSDAGEPAEAIVQYASADFFEVLGLRAEVGRTFVADLEHVETTEVVLSHRYWQERFGEDPDAVGRTLSVDGTPVVVVGVLPRGYVVFG